MVSRLIAGTLLALVFTSSVHAQGDVRRGAEAFRQCAACHSLEPGRHLTGPSLAGVVGRAAATAPGFRRYSEALAESRISWTEETLDRWLQHPREVVPETSMRIRPIADAGVRQDLIAFLKTAGGQGAKDTAGAAMMGGRMPNLKQAPPGQRVSAIRYCPDAYWVTLASGEILTFWEFNLRFKTDSSADGPAVGQPAIVGQGMQGDRAQVVFSEPAEISAFIVKDCAGG